MAIKLIEQAIAIADVEESTAKYIIQVMVV
jgi:hypothetical protein